MTLCKTMISRERANSFNSNRHISVAQKAEIALESMYTPPNKFFMNLIMTHTV